MSKELYLIAFILLLTSCGGKGTKNKETEPVAETKNGIEYPFTIDTSIDYPEKSISFQELFGELEYVKLETRKECFISNLLRDITVTDEYIFLIEGGTTLLRFDRTGKFLNRIGNKGRGPGEFLTITAYCLNDEKEEIYVRDGLTKTILIFDYEGKYKRSFRLPQYRTVEMGLVNDSTLIVSNGIDGNINFDPFQLVSLTDGRITGTPIGRFKDPEAIVDMDVAVEDPKTVISQRPELKESRGAVEIAYSMRKLESGNFKVSFLDNNNIYITDEGAIILSNFVSDTVYIADENGEVYPRFIKLPSNEGINDPMSRTYFRYQFETPDYALFAYLRPKGAWDALLLDKSDGSITSTWLYNSDIDTQRSNTRTITHSKRRGRFCYPYQAEHLVTLFEEEKLSGELKAIAATLTEDDNPVLLIEK